MRDEYFELFIETFGEATYQADVPAESIERWRGILPGQLLTYWRQEGWCGYANGRFWTIDPSKYQDLVDAWLAGTPLEQIDIFHAIARTAFGDLYLWGEKIGRGVTISCEINAIIALQSKLKKNVLDPDMAIQIFFGARELNDCDLKDEFGKPLFERALKKLGPVDLDEMYGFEPALVLGGSQRLENLAKVKLDQHLTILRQLAPPTLPFSNIDIDKLTKS